MKLDVLGLQAFVGIATTGSFARAADVLNVTSPALTRRLANLEAQLQVQLLERTTRAIALTPAGETLLPRARHLLEELSTTFKELNAKGQAQHGTVTLACVPTVGVRFLPALLREYGTRHPNNRVRILDHTSYGVAQAVHLREAEFGISMADAQLSDLDTVPVLKDRMALICRRDHPLANRRKLKWSDLRAHTLIVPGAGSSNRPVLDAALGPLNLKLTARYEVQRSATAVGLAAQGLGAAIVPALSVEKDAYPQLRLLELNEPIVERTFVTLRRRGSSLSIAAQALYDLILRHAQNQDSRRK